MPHRPMLAKTAALGAALLLASTSLVVTPPERAAACALAGREGALPHIDAEQALVAWNPSTRLEHFVRRADFADARAEFAFLVPTPSRPTLGEIDDAIFDRLASVFAPRPRSEQVLRGMPRGPETSAVTVVEQRRVAGLDATVLAASDARALADWLRAHGFAGRAGLDRWLAPYVRDGFFVTAFRYVPGGDGRALGAAVRLTFTTPRPFYPYAEPPDAPQRSGRRFLLTVVSNERVEGRVGDARWNARVRYAGAPYGLARLLDGLPDAASLGPWMTTFEETSSRRGQADLVFVRAGEQREVGGSRSR